VARATSYALDSDRTPEHFVYDVALVLANLRATRPSVDWTRCGSWVRKDAQERVGVVRFARLREWARRSMNPRPLSIATTAASRSEVHRSRVSMPGWPW
jgi:hypothetical protein